VAYHSKDNGARLFFRYEWIFRPIFLCFYRPTVVLIEYIWFRRHLGGERTRRCWCCFKDCSSADKRTHYTVVATATVAGL